MEQIPEPKRARAADAVVERLEAQIFSGELADGKPLPAERELIEAFNVSRTVVREAVRILASKGFQGALLEEGVRVVTSDRDRWVDFMLTEDRTFYA